MIFRQGRIAILLAALICAALFFFVAGCDDSSSKGRSTEKSSEKNAGLIQADGRQVVRGGIGPNLNNGANLLYEEKPEPGFTDYISHVDYAIAQALERTGETDSLKVSQGELCEHDGTFYRQQILIAKDVADVHMLKQALGDSILAWAEKATLTEATAAFCGCEAEDMALQVTLDGAITHYICLSNLAGERSKDSPRLVIVIDDLGESKRHARRLLALNYPVTFAIWPYSSHARAVANMANDGGAEVIIHQPMEPMGYPRVNPGEHVLLSGMDESEVLSILEDSFKRVPYAIGLNNHMGSRLTQDEKAMQVVAGKLASQGMLMLDSLTHAKSRFAKSAVEAGGKAYKRDIFLDVEADKEKILAQLKKAEQVALVKGQAIAIGHPLSATLNALEDWQNERNPNVILVRLQDLSPIKLSAKVSGANIEN